MKKIIFSVVFSFFVVGYLAAQGQTPEQKAKAKVEAVAKFIDATIKNKAIAEKKTPDPKAVVSAAQKKSITEAYTTYYAALQAFTDRRGALVKAAADLNAKNDEVNARIDAFNKKYSADVQVENEEEAKKIEEAKNKETAEIEQMKADLAKMQEGLTKEQEEIKAFSQDDLEAKVDEDIKKALNADQVKAYEEMRAKSKKK